MTDGGARDSEGCGDLGWRLSRNSRCGTFGGEEAESAGAGTAGREGAELAGMETTGYHSSSAREYSGNSQAQSVCLTWTRQ